MIWNLRPPPCIIVRFACIGLIGAIATAATTLIACAQTMRQGQTLQSPIAAMSESANFGKFSGKAIVEFLPDGRNVRIESGLSYTDPDGTVWDVPAGTETDGASVPAVFWFMYPPFTGSYRYAAFVHDFYCQTKSRSWQATHLMFYYASRAAGVSERDAEIMYAAVYWMGPHWGKGGAVPKGMPAPPASEGEQEQTMRKIEAYIDRENPDVHEIPEDLQSGKALAEGR